MNVTHSPSAPCSPNKYCDFRAGPLYVFRVRFVISLRASCVQISTKFSSTHFSRMHQGLGAAQRCHLDQRNDRCDRSPLNVNMFSHSVLTWLEKPADSRPSLFPTY